MKVRKTAEQFALSLKATNGFFSVLGPAPAVIEKIKSQYRWHIIIKNAKSTDPAGHRLRQALQKAKTSIESTRKQDVRLIVDVDPGGLM